MSGFKNNSIANNVAACSWLLLVVILVFLGYFWIYDEYRTLRAQSSDFENQFIAEQKNTLKNKVQEVTDFVRFKESQLEQRMLTQIRNRAYEAHDVASHLHEINRQTCSDREMEMVIKEALRPLRYNNNHGYYFIVSLDGREILFADRPATEGRVALDLTDAQGKYIVQDMIRIVEEKGEGFYQYSWTKPGETGSYYPKMSYLKKFDEMDWIIGTGLYLDEVENEIKQEALLRIDEIRYGNDGYIFVFTSDGLMVNHIDPGFVGKNLIDITDPNGVKVLRQLINVSRSPSGGFVHYSWPKPSTGRNAPKLSYAQEFPQWGWIIGTGVYLDDMEGTIEARRAGFEKEMRNRLFFLAGLLLGFSLLIISIYLYLSRKISRGLNTLIDFFRKAAISSQKIEIARLVFPEFQILGRVANKMVEDRISAESEIRAQRDRAQKYLDIAGVMFVALDKTGKVSLMNRKAEEVTGCTSEEIIGTDWFENFIPEEQRPRVRRIFDLIMAGKARTFEYTENSILTSDGEERIIVWHNVPVLDRDGNIIGALSSGEDTTDRRQTQEELDKSRKIVQDVQRLDAIGTLAGGIAHDFNNILASILGFTDLALMDVPAESPLHDKLQQVKNAGNRARDLVMQILTFSRQTEHEKKTVLLNTVINDSINLARASIPSTISIENDITDENLVIMADPTQIEQVIMNLITNASHSMHEEGTLGISLLREKPEKKLLLSFPELEDNYYAVIRISDTGSGMPPEIIDKIFDPFFTTKPAGKGTGIGLSVVHGIVKESDGTINVESDEGRGTTFTVFLPLVHISTMQEPTEEEDLPGGTERILVVDDEEVIVSLIDEMLTRIGYTITAMTSSEEALELFSEKPSSIDLVITDMTMPRLTGDKLARRIHEIRPEIPVILCSGYSESFTDKDTSDAGISAFVPKPIVMADIARTIRKVLDRTI